MNPPCTSETSSPGYRELRAARADEIEDVAEALAEEQGTHLWLQSPREREFTYALAIRAVATLTEPFGELEKELADAEERAETLEVKLEEADNDRVTARNRVEEVYEALQILLGAAGLPPHAQDAIQLMLSDLSRKP